MLDEQTGLTFVPVGVVSQALVAGNPKRRSLILAIPSGMMLTIHYATPVVLHQGFDLSNQTYPYIFDTDRYGDMPTRALFCIASVAGNVGVIEVFRNVQDYDVTSLANRSLGVPGADYRSVDDASHRGNRTPGQATFGVP
jgi:hypothetical protein